MDGVAAPAPTLGNLSPSGAQLEQKANRVNLGGPKCTPTLQPGGQGSTLKLAIAKPAVIVQGRTVRQSAPPSTINGNEVAYLGGSLRTGITAVPIAPVNRGQPPSPVAI